MIRGGVSVYAGCSIMAMLGFAFQAAAQVTLTNAGVTAGVNVNHLADPTCMNSVTQAQQSGGLAVGDFNNDSWPDFFSIGGGGGLNADRLFINDGDGTFTNMAAAWGVNAVHGGCGASVGDYNNDGWLDIYVTSFGQIGMPGQPGKHKLYRNNGDSIFSEVAVAAGVNQTTVNVANGYGSAFGDYDLDGDLDLFVTAWKDLIGPGNGGTGNRLFRNNGDETFTDATTDALGTELAGVWGFQAAFVDMNGDLWPELLISADFESSRYFINNGDGTFTNATAASGTGLDDNGMGQTVGDFNRDGLLDWYVTSIYKDPPNPGQYNGNTLYVQQSPHSYLEVASTSGCQDGGWGWGTVAIDFDQDGWQDIVEVNGRASSAEWQFEREYLYHNDGDGTFTEIGIAAGLNLADEGRAVARLDADRDGDQDIVILVNNDPLRFFRNDTASIGNWLTLTFDTTTNPNLAPNGFGTHAIAHVGAANLVRFMSSDPSYLATSEHNVHFGVGGASVIDSLEIRWARGQVSRLANIAVNQFLTIQAPVPADVTADGDVDVDDLLAIINSWGACLPPSVCASDTNIDGSTNVDDLLAVINSWGGTRSQEPVDNTQTGSSGSPDHVP